MKRKDLEKALEEIGWKVNNSSNGLNDWIYNNEGNRTKIRVLESRLDIQVDGIFGGKYEGNINFEFKDCEVEVHEKKDSVDMYCKENKSVFIQFLSI